MANIGKAAGKSSVFMGVSWQRREEKWRASIRIPGKKKTIGSFLHEADAALAYNFSALEIHGEFARMNTPAMVRLGRP